MNTLSITTTKLKIQIALLAVLALALLPAIVSAHGGEEHVIEIGRASCRERV